MVVKQFHQFWIQMPLGILAVRQRQIVESQACIRRFDYSPYQVGSTAVCLTRLDLEAQRLIDCGSKTVGNLGKDCPG
jgi:hypothetical protein